MSQTDEQQYSQQKHEARVLAMGRLRAAKLTFTRRSHIPDNLIIRLCAFWDSRLSWEPVHKSSSSAG